jgi:predicted TIM-barrel fold metal-dependent hydrolase
LKGVEIKPSPSRQPFWHDSWEVLWQAAEETGLPVHFHSDIGRLQLAGSAEDRRAFGEKKLKGLVEALSKMSNAEHLGAMIVSGVLERHPGLTLVLGECDLSWIPHFLARMDFTFMEREYGLAAGLPLKPSDYWYRQCKATFQKDQLGMELIGRLGADNVMWGNDYPHPDGVWPISQDVNAVQMGSLTDAERRKVLRDNAARLYGFN